jgi:RNA polymerase sigma factor (sigma-70 family)
VQELRGLTDAQLLARVADGESTALGVIVDRHKDAVFRYARSLVSDASQAEDALQQTFIDALRGAGGFAGGATARGWLLTLARNAVYRGARRRSGEPRQFVPLDQLGCLAGWGDDPEQATARRLDRECLRRALDTLGPDAREVILLRDLEGFSGPEAAEMLGLSLAGMKSRLHRARLELAAAVRREVPHGT